MSQYKFKIQELSVGYLITKTAHFLKIAGLQIFKQQQFNITQEQFVILYILRNENGISQRQLGRLALKDRPNVTRLLDILEQRGCVERKTDTEDRRIIRVFITDEGHQQVEAVLPAARKVGDKALKGLTEEEIATLKTILGKIRNNLEEIYKLQD